MARGDDIDAAGDDLRALYSAFVDISPMLLWTVDAAGRLSFASDEIAARIGAPRHFTEPNAHLKLFHPADRRALLSTLRKAEADGSLVEAEYRMRVADGSYRWMRIRTRFDAARGCWHGVAEDIHDHRSAQDALRIANERLALALDENESWAWDFDIAAGRFWFSDRWQAVLGYAADEIAHDLTDFATLVHRQDQPLVDRLFRAHLAGKTPQFEADYRIRRKAGGWVWVQDRGRVVERDAEGRPRRAVGVRTDITARKAAEAHARANETYLKTVLDSISDAVIAVGAGGRRGFYNKAYAHMFLEQVEGDVWEDLGQLFKVFDVSDDAGRPIPIKERPIVRILRGETIENMEVTATLRETGRRYRLVYNGQPVRGPDGSVELAVLSIRDVTDSEAALSALAASEERLRLATEGAGMGTWDYDLPAGTGVWSESASRLLGYPSGPDRRWTMADFRSRVHPDDLDDVLANIARAEAAREPYVIDFRILRADDGAMRWIESFGSYIYENDGPVRHVGVFFDITDRKLADERLRESEAQLEAIIESLEEGVVAYRPGAPGGFTNSAFRRMAAPHDPEWRTFTDVGEGLRAFELIDPDGNALTPDQRPMPRLLRGERVERLAARARFRDGRELDVICRGEPLFDAQGRVRLAILAVRNMTEQYKAEADLASLQQELIHVSRVSAMGTMAGSLAHELNQPLAAITNYATAAQMMSRQDEPPLGRLREALAHVAGESLRAGQIVSRLRRFITKGEVERQPASLEAIVREALAIAHHDSTARSVQVKLKLDSAADAIVADRIQIQQVIFNLVRNAVEAMTGAAAGGEITIISREAGDEVELLIADRGPGLPAEVAQHLFEPFITTKEGGMGIGLPICRSIMRAHGGEIRAEARPRGGTVFILTLPRLVPAEAA